MHVYRQRICIGNIYNSHHISIMTWDKGVLTYRLWYGINESAHIDYDTGQCSPHIYIMTCDNWVRTYRLWHGTKESAYIDDDVA